MFRGLTILDTSARGETPRKAGRKLSTASSACAWLPSTCGFTLTTAKVTSCSQTRVLGDKSTVRGTGAVSAFAKDAAVSNWPRWAQPVRLLTGSEEPGGSDLGALRKRQSIFHIDAKIAHGVVDLGMAE